jgi:hypothetical protein
MVFPQTKQTYCGLTPCRVFFLLLLEKKKNFHPSNLSTIDAAASNLGVLLTDKKMDSEASCAMWEEANLLLKANVLFYGI